jgi:hypothetical protein
MKLTDEFLSALTVTENTKPGTEKTNRDMALEVARLFKSLGKDYQTCVDVARVSHRRYMLSQKENA